MGNEREQDNWLGTTLRQTPATAPDDCLDAETLAAWADGGLDAKAVAAVELHASQCSRCTAVLAAMERSAPAAPARHAWTSARLFRWLVPLTAAATAVAIWIAVPDRPITPVEPATVQDVRDTSERTDAAAKPDAPNAELGRQRAESLYPEPAPITPQPPPVLTLPDEDRRERASEEALDATAAAPRAAPSPVAPPPAAATGTLAETATFTAKRSALNIAAFSTESVSPSNQLMRWRIVAPGTIERSADGGKTWTGTTSPAPTLAGIRAVDADRAVARTTVGADFYTSDGGLSWTRVQENATAPF